jgi:hypothetical protein
MEALRFAPADHPPGRRSSAQLGPGPARLRRAQGAGFRRPGGIMIHRANVPPVLCKQFAGVVLLLLLFLCGKGIHWPRFILHTI